jgi:hypothetical protein
MDSKRTILWKEYMSRDIPHIGWEKNYLEGAHIKGHNRGRDIRL